MLGREAGPLFQRYATLLDEELDGLAALAGDVQASLDAVQAERGAVCAELARVYLPVLTQEALDDAEKRTGLRAFGRQKPLEGLAREEKKLAARVVGLEADEKWARRTALVGPQGSLTRSLAEAKDLLEPWQRDCERFEFLEGFTELVEIGYDTPAFEERWWQPGYWRHWAQGDKICAALGLPDFGDDVLPAWEKAREPRDKWRAEVARIEAAIAAVHDHVRNHDQVVFRLAHLADIYLEEAQKVLAEHLLRADVQLLASWAGDDRGVTVLLKRLSGLVAKADILTEMLSQWIKPSRESAAAARAKFMAKAQKLARPKKWGVDVRVPDGVEEKLVARQARQQKARSYVKRVVAFDAYDRFDLAQPPETWWLHMQDNRRPGLFTPRLRTWYDRHPNVVVLADPDWESARGDAFAATHVLADTGDIS